MVALFVSNLFTFDLFTDEHPENINKNTIKNIKGYLIILYITLYLTLFELYIICGGYLVNLKIVGKKKSLLIARRLRLGLVEAMDQTTSEARLFKAALR
jgi:hypothetical protein